MQGDGVLKTVVVNTCALLAGIIVGGLVNMGLVVLGPAIIPPPAGVDVTQVASIAESIHLFETKHFVFPFLAHSIGTLVGALVAHCVAASHRNKFAYAIGIVFLLGGIANSFMIPTPLWYLAVDLVGAYLPMAWLATLIGWRCRPARMQP